MTLVQGFIAGAIVAVLIQGGIIVVSVPLESLTWVVLAIAAIFTLARTLRQQSLINTTVDGFILGLAWIFAFIGLARSAPLSQSNTAPKTTTTG
jgi:hypothetical protein